MSIDQSATQDENAITGGTDGTFIGNVGDRMKVTNAASNGGIGTPSITNKLVYSDMNVSTGGVARETAIGTSFTNVFSHSGTGLLFGFILHLGSLGATWFIRLVIDSNEIFETAGLSMGDLTSGSIYNYPDAGVTYDIAIRRESNVFKFYPNFPVQYSTDVIIKVKHSSSKNFKAGMVMLTKET